MKHSSTWPNHVVTVKVCINSLLRSYTITSENKSSYQPSANEIFTLQEFLSDSEHHVFNNNQFPKVINSVGSNTDSARVKYEIEAIGIDQSYVKNVDRVKGSIAFTIGEESNLNGNVGNRLDNELLNHRQGIEFITIKENQAYKQNETLVTGDQTSKISQPTEKVITETKFVNSAVILKNNLKPPIITVANYDVASTSSVLTNNQNSDQYRTEEFLRKQINDPLHSPVEKIRTKNLWGEKRNFSNRRFRSRSATYELPPVLTESFERRTKSFVESRGSENKKNDVTHLSVSNRKEVTLTRHYYPEGGWGFVIVTCSALVHFLGVGLQFAAPGTWHISAKLKFNHPPLYSAGFSESRRNSFRRGSELSIKSSHRGSIGPITPKMMRRRFSEQLILEGGLTCEPELEELAEEDPEESLTAVNARKRVTLKTHYYPEGDWGFVVMFVAITVQLINHGIHVGVGVFLSATTKQYNKSITGAGRV